MLKLWRIESLLWLLLQVFSWGNNCCGQLGHMEAFNAVPCLAKVTLTDSEGRGWVSSVITKLFSLLLLFFSYQKESVFGTQVPGTSTHCCWLMETASNQSSTTVASRK